MTTSPESGIAGSLVVDTHSIIWFLQHDLRLSEAARKQLRAALNAGHAIYVPSICLVEVVYLVDKGRIPEQVAERLKQILAEPLFGFRLAVLDQAVADATRRISRGDVPDLPDRVVAATALALDLPLVTRDGKNPNGGNSDDLVTVPFRSAAVNVITEQSTGAERPTYDFPLLPRLRFLKLAD